MASTQTASLTNGDGQGAVEDDAVVNAVVAMELQSPSSAIGTSMWLNLSVQLVLYYKYNKYNI